MPDFLQFSLCILGRVLHPFLAIMLHVDIFLDMLPTDADDDIGHRVDVEQASVA